MSSRLTPALRPGAAAVPGHGDPLPWTPFRHPTRCGCRTAIRPGTSAGPDALPTTGPAIGRRSLPLGLLLIVLTLPLTACGSWPGMRRSAGTGALGDRNREDPALSSQGRILASVMPRGGRPSVVLQEQPSGRLLPMGPLNRWTPHRSPSLSRNGRYLALLVQHGERSLPVIWDRASGQLHRLPLQPDQEAVRLSLSPEGRRLAIEVWREGRARVRLFDLSGLLEPDLPGGLRVQGGGPPPKAP